MSVICSANNNNRDGHGAMVRARSFVNVAAFDVVSLGKALNPQMLHLTQVKMSRPTW